MRTRIENPVSRALGWCLILAVWISLGVLAAAHLWGWLLGAYSNDRTILANTPLNVSRISIPDQRAGEPARSWKFAVLGDLGKRYEIFSDFLSRMQRDDIRFVIVCGDLVYRVTPEQYDYLHLKIAHSGFDRPIFAAVGNHDVLGKDDYALFRHYLGGPAVPRKTSKSGDLSYGDRDPERFAFLVPERPPFTALFIIFDNVFGPPDTDQLLWIEGLLNNYRSQVKHVFLFGHVPVIKAPKQLQKVPSEKWLMPYERMEEQGPDPKTAKLVYELIQIDPVRGRIPLIPLTKNIDPKTKKPAFLDPDLVEGYEALYELFDRYRVTAVFSGDLHGYARYQIGSTLHFVSGGGGARLQYPEAMHHYLQVAVDGHELNVRPVVVMDKSSLVGKLEQILVAEIFLFFGRRPWLYVALVFWLAVGIAAVLKGKRRNVGA